MALSPNHAPPSKNSTFVTSPPGSEALAVSVSVGGATKSAPSVGLVRLAQGSAIPGGALTAARAPATASTQAGSMPPGAFQFTASE